MRLPACLLACLPACLLALPACMEVCAFWGCFRQSVPAERKVY